MQNYEKAVAQALYACVRAGRLDDAIDLTKKAQQPWRAAAIRGSTLFQWRGICAYFCGICRVREAHSTLASEPRDEGDDEFSTFDDGSWRGNKRRKLWKSACIHGALNVRETHQPRDLSLTQHAVKPPRSRAGPICLPSTFIPNICRIEISVPHMGGLPMGSSEHNV